MEALSRQMTTPAPPRKVNIATVRVFRVLGAFVFGKPSYGVSELSKELGMSKNMVFRALSTLIAEGLLVRDAAGAKYELGYRALELQNPNFEDPDIRTLCRPYMQRMHEMSGLTVALQIPVGHSHVTIDGVESRGAILTRVQWGVAVPLHVSPASRAILANLSDEEIEHYIRQNSPLQKVTENTITDPDELWEEVRLVRSRGYAVSYKDHFADVRAVAFPVLDSDRRPHGAITVVGPEEQISAERMDELIPELKKVADELNAVGRVYHASPILGR